MLTRHLALPRHTRHTGNAGNPPVLLGRLNMAKQTVTVTAPAVGPLVNVVPGAKVAFRQGSARAVYYAAFAAHNGQPLATLAAAILANPPSMPKRGKLAGQVEPFAGWVRWFVRHGYITLG